MLHKNIFQEKPKSAIFFVLLHQKKNKPLKNIIMKDTKIERLTAAAEKAEKTLNRAANWEASRNNAAARLMAINAAAAIMEGTDDVAVADATEYLHCQFMASFNAQAKARVAFEASFSAIKAAATPEVLANAVNARGFQFDAAIRGCYQAIKAAAKVGKAAAWAEVTEARAERAEKKSKNARKRAERAAARAAATSND